MPMTFGVHIRRKGTLPHCICLTAYDASAVAPPLKPARGPIRLEPLDRDRVAIGRSIASERQRLGSTPSDILEEAVLHEP